MSDMNKKVPTTQGAASGEMPSSANVPLQKNDSEKAETKPLGKVQKKKKGKGQRKVKNLDMLKKAAKNVMAGKDAFDDNEAPEPDEDDGAY